MPGVQEMGVPDLFFERHVARQRRDVVLRGWVDEIVDAERFQRAGEPDMPVVTMRP
jgi:hypothetical protein